MQYQKFGNTGLSVSRLCLGTMTFGLQIEQEDIAHAILDKAADAGVNFIDTADVYPLGGGEQLAGRTEEIVGRWLKGKRDRFIVATKAVGKVGPSPWDQGASRKHLLDAIDASLRRLGTDYVDLYQLHSDDRETPIDETLEALDVIVRSGKARYVGVSNFLAYRLALALGRADFLRTARFVSVQPRYNLLFRQIERELLPLAEEQRSPSSPITRSPAASLPASTSMMSRRQKAASVHSFAAPAATICSVIGTSANSRPSRSSAALPKRPGNRLPSLPSPGLRPIRSSPQPSSAPAVLNN